jgi:hypothetical protein
MTPRNGGGGRGAGINLADDGNALACEELVGRLIGAPVGGLFGPFAHDQAFDVGAGGFVVGGAGAVVADLGVGQNDDLTRVTRVGEYFLIAGDRGVEYPYARPGKTLPSSRAKIAAIDKAPPDGLWNNLYSSISQPLCSTKNRHQVDGAPVKWGVYARPLRKARFRP